MGGQWVMVPDGMALRVGSGAALMYVMPVVVPTLIPQAPPPPPTVVPSAQPMVQAQLQAGPVQVAPESPVTVHLIPSPPG